MNSLKQKLRFQTLYQWYSVVSERKRVFYLASHIFYSDEEAFNGNYTLPRRPVRKNNVVIIEINKEKNDEPA